MNEEQQIYFGEDPPEEDVRRLQDAVDIDPGVKARLESLASADIKSELQRVLDESEARRRRSQR